MTYNNIPSIIWTLLGGAIVSLLVLWRDMGIIKAWKLMVDDERKIFRETQQLQNQHLAAQDVMLAHIEEKVTELLEIRRSDRKPNV